MHPANAKEDSDQSSSSFGALPEAGVDTHQQGRICEEYPGLSVRVSLSASEIIRLPLKRNIAVGTPASQPEVKRRKQVRRAHDIVPSVQTVERV